MRATVVKVIEKVLGLTGGYGTYHEAVPYGYHLQPYRTA